MVIVAYSKSYPSVVRVGPQINEIEIKWAEEYWGNPGPT